MGANKTVISLARQEVEDVHVSGPLLGLIPARRRWPRRWARGLLHETRCAECRVSWRSWRRRLLGDGRGYSPSTHG